MDKCGHIYQLSPFKRQVCGRPVYSYGLCESCFNLTFALPVEFMTLPRVNVAREILLRKDQQRLKKTQTKLSKVQ